MTPELFFSQDSHDEILENLKWFFQERSAIFNHCLDLYLNITKYFWKQREHSSEWVRS